MTTYNIYEAIDALLQANKENYAVISDLQKRVSALEIEVPHYPFDVKNSKLTYPDATELFFPDFINKKSEFFEILPDGSFKYTLPKDVIGTTPKAKFSRIEHRLYKDAKAKTDFTFDDLIKMRYGVIFHALPAGERLVFGQVHGKSTKPYMKAGAGKGTIALLCGLEENATKDTILDFKHDPILGKKYIFEFEQQGANLVSSILHEDGKLISTVQTDKFTRKDMKYPKAGAYGPGPAQVTFFKV